MRVEACFTVTGEGLEFSVIEEATCLEPTDVWRVGEAVGFTQLCRKCDGWRYAVSHEDNVDASAVMASVVDRLSPACESIRLLGERGWHSEVSCVVYTSGQMPVLNFKPCTISSIARLGASLDIDIILSAS